MVDHDPDRITVVGRARERTLMSASLQAALSGKGSLLLLNGPGGSGKTSLLTNLLADARDAGALAAIGHSWDGGVAPPYDAWRQIVVSLASQTGVDPALFPTPLGSGPPPDASAQLIEEVKAAFYAIARATPLLVVLDDLHAADPDTLELLEHLTRDLQRMPLLAAAAWRTDSLSSDNSLIDILPRLRHDRRVELIQLGPLEYDDIVALTEWRAGPPADDLARYLLNRSDGNPLYVTELLRHLAARALLHPDANGLLRAPSQDAGVPELLRQIVDQRILRLGAEVESLIEIGAVIGVEWELAVVEAVLGWPEERLLAALERAVSSQIIVLARESPETYRFTHALIREALLDRLVVRRRRQLHTRIAEALERLAETDAAIDARAPALAFHFRSSDAWDRAVEFDIRAGDVARSAFAHRSALAHYEQALDAAARDVHVEIATQALIHERLGQMNTILRRQQSAQDAFSAMRDAAQSAGDPALEGRSLFWLSFLSTRRYAFDVALSLAEQASSVARESSDDHLHALAHFQLGHIHKVDGRYRASQHELELALRYARQLDASDVLGWTLCNLAQLATIDGRYGVAERDASEALALARAMNDGVGIGRASWALGMALGEQGKYEVAIDVFERGIAYARDSGDQHYLMRLTNSMGWLFSEVGDSATANRWDQEALDLSRASAVVHLADRVTEAERYALLNLATDALQSGDPAAELHLVEFMNLTNRDEYARARYHNRYQLVRSELALVQSQTAVALRWATEAESFAAETGQAKNVLKARLLQGRTHRTIGRLPEAIALLNDAVERADALAHGSLRWQSRLWLGDALLAARDSSAAATFALAVKQVDAIAAGLVPQRRECLLASPLVRKLRSAIDVTSRPAPPAYPGGLSAREIDVLRLVARGATNAAIADSLFISVRTVDAHVGSILTKTGAANRAGAATFAQRHGLVDPDGPDP